MRELSKTSPGSSVVGASSIFLAREVPQEYTFPAYLDPCIPSFTVSALGGVDKAYPLESRNRFNFIAAVLLILLASGMAQIGSSIVESVVIFVINLSVRLYAKNGLVHPYDCPAPAYRGAVTSGVDCFCGFLNIGIPVPLHKPIVKFGVNDGEVPASKRYVANVRIGWLINRWTDVAATLIAGFLGATAKGLSASAESCRFVRLWQRLGALFLQGHDLTSNGILRSGRTFIIQAAA
jgi:hypothetical protein